MLTLMPSQAFAVYKSGMSIVHILEVAQIVSSLNKSFKFAEQMRGQFPRTSLYWPAKPFWPTSGRSLCTCTETKQAKTNSTKDVILVLICLQVHNNRFYGHQEFFTGQYQFWGYTEEGPRLLWTLILSLSNRVLGLALGCLSISFVMLEILGVLKRIRGPQVPIGAHSWA